MPKIVSLRILHGALLTICLIFFQGQHFGSAFAAPDFFSDVDYPVGIAEDQSGNIYIVDNNNSIAARKGIVVLPSSSGILFGQSVTVGTESVIISRDGTNGSPINGVAVRSDGTLLFTDSNGTLFALSGLATTVFGMPVNANTETEILINTGMSGPIEFDLTGNLFGVQTGTSNISVIGATSGQLLGNNVSQNQPSPIQTLLSGDAWLWDIAIDTLGNLYVTDPGWNTNNIGGVWVIPAENQNSLYGDAVAKGSYTRLTAFPTNQNFSGIDIDEEDNIFVNVWSGRKTYVLTKTDTELFGQNIQAGVATVLTESLGYPDQGILITNNGDLIIGGNPNTFRLVSVPAPAPAPAPVNVRQTSNLSFAQSLHASDTLSDEDGQLRATVDQIMNKYGSLIK